MKKALIFLLSLAVVGAVFAQDTPSLTFSGSLQTGFVYQMGDNTDPAIAYGWADDAGKDGYRLRLAGTAVNGNTGAKFRLSSVYAAGTPVVLDYAWTYVDLLDSMLHIDFGYKIDDNAWRTKGDDEIDYDPANGAKVQIKPIEGLNLGFAVGMGSNAAEGKEIADLQYIVGFAYSAAPIGFQAGLNLTTADDPSTPATEADAGLQGAYVGFDYTDVVPGLSVYAEADFQNLAYFSDFGRIKASEKVKYVTGPIEAALVATEFLYQSSDVDMGLKIKGSVSYTAGNLIPAIEVVYNNDEYDIDEGFGEYSTLTIKPTLEVKFTDKTKVVSGYEYVAMTDMAFDNSQKLFVNFRYDF